LNGAGTLDTVPSAIVELVAALQVVRDSMRLNPRGQDTAAEGFVGSADAVAHTVALAARRPGGRQ